MNKVMKLNLFNLILLVNFSTKIPITLLIPIKIAAAPDKQCTSYVSAVSVGNAFSSKLET